ncbi:5-dehydro-4-deoxy-D-glucuronate isomerase [Solirubrum puertoriconensis]|uniref:4-deoxy-L-threo-5-hexosulose-uronate ketol-isomerase n=1 Tax=Solirubrum puertoriconensis TaxID=1751427 RepID=A0A9X0HK64_SOLP1|nr:5-dehydro-4-deoxy-D-glucuronate isomerase [Solirubrum puertoriconensis]KUG07454.1 5-keto-4-deoxyuronate isomerase [Solirubrum puertoriconensis]
MLQRYACSPRETAAMNTAQLRENYLIEQLFVPGEIELVYTHYDRMIVGGATPGAAALSLPCPDELKAEYFLERRELGILNVGEAGEVTVDGTTYALGNQDCLYVGKGSREVSFAGEGARYYLLSAPAHAEYPTTLRTQAEATPVEMGALETANQRTIYKYIYSEGIQSCQLVMGLTQLKPGSVWNTMPSHTHTRRMEAYLYFNLPAGQRVLHLMGEPHETRPLWVSNEQAILSPPWSIHTGCGTAAYAFIWGMAGENREYTDMDAVALDQLR